MNAWPFLISRNRSLGFNVIVAPQFLHKQGLADILLEAAAGEQSQQGEAFYCEIHGSSGAMSLIFRVVRAQQKLLGSDLSPRQKICSRKDNRST